MAIRLVAIGVSHWHSLWDAAYLHHFTAMDGVEIVGVQDEDPVVAEHRVKEIGGGVPAFTDYRQMVEELVPDMALALGRHDTMAEVGSFLIDRRVPYLMEKPMSFSARQLKGVVDKAEETGAFAAVPLSQRHTRPIRMARRLIEDGTYGPLSHFYSRMNRPTSARYPAWNAAWMLDPAKSNGGCLRNLGNHGLDCFVYLTGEGEDIEVTGANLSWATHSERVEDYASVFVKSGSGVIGTVEVGNAFPWDGTDGEMKVAFRDAVIVDKDGVTKLHTAEGEQVVPEEAGHAYLGILDATVQAVVNGDPPPVSIADCYRAVRLIDMAYIAAGNPYGTAEA